MPFLAHVGIELGCDYIAYEKEHWYTYLKRENFEIRWRFRNDLIYEVVAGPFEERYTALRIAKYIFVTLLINFLYKEIPVEDAGLQFYEHRLYIDGQDPYANSTQEFNDTEAFYFWNPHFRGGEVGIGVYEVPSFSIEEINLYDPLIMRPERKAYMTDDDANKLCFDNLGSVYFSFDREVQTVFLSLFEAEKSFNIGFQAEKYCGILEHLSCSCPKGKEVVEEIDRLMEHVRASTLPSEDKDGLINYLNQGKQMSSIQKCRELVKKYGKSSYFSTDSRQILQKTYKIRSSYSHGEDCSKKYDSVVSMMKCLVLDVINNYYHEKEDTHV